jgi:hypothetical protein
MAFAEKRLFSLDHSLQACIFQVTMHSSCRERLVDDVLKWFGDLCGIFSLPSAKKMDSMVGIGGGELGGTPTQGLLE